MRTPVINLKKLLLVFFAVLSAPVLAGIPDLSSFGGGEPTFLPPDQAYVYSATVEDGFVVAEWVIAEDYYLYKKQFQFHSDTPGVVLGTPQLPTGEMHTDEFFGAQEIYRGILEVRIPIVQGLGAFNFRVRYQGCADAGLCYPPQTRTLALAVSENATAQTPVVTATESATTTAAGQRSEQDQLGDIIRSASLWSVMLVFFGAGLLLTFTPCVLPMVPIISSLVIGQGRDIGTGKAFLISLVYVLAMAFTYTIAGALVAYFGGNLNAWFQNIWVLGAFSLIFVLLALSMFGWYELQMPAGVQARLAALSNRQQGGTLLGAGVMGLLSALIVGPCITAPLVAAFIAIGQTGEPLRGAAALFSMSIGMGVPLLIIGTSAGKLLPKTGAWMNVIKAIFGFLLLGLAVWFMARVVPGWLSMLGWTVLLLSCGLYFLDLKPDNAGWRVALKTLGLLLAAWGLALLIGLSAGNRDVLQPLAGLGGGAVQENHLVFKRIKSVDDLQREVAAATAQGRTVMLDFYADWCISCKEMEKYTFTDPGVQSALANTVLLQADVTANDAVDQALLDHFGIFGPPSIMFFNSRGAELKAQRVVGFMPADEFRAHIIRIFGNE